MARDLNTLLASYETQYGSKFDMAPFDLIKSMVSEKAANAAIMTHLRELLPTAGKEEETDWADQFIKAGENATLVQAVRRSVAALSEALAAARKDGSQLTINVDVLAAPDAQVVLNNKPKRTRTTIDRAYDATEDKVSLGSILKHHDVQELMFKLAGNEYKLPVKYTKPSDTNPSGAQFRDQGKWLPVGNLKSVVSAYAKDVTKSGSVNTWAVVKVKMDDTTIMTIGTLYDDFGGEDDGE